MRLAEIKLDYALDFSLAQRAFCAAAILLRLAAEIVLLGVGVEADTPFALCFSHLAFCAREIFRREAALMLCPFPWLGRGLVCVGSEPRKATAMRVSFAISCSTSASILLVSKYPPGFGLMRFEL